jgi:hypothetical protein
MMIGCTVGAVAIIVALGVIVNAYVTSHRLANVLSDVEEVIHADLKTLEEKIEAALTRIRIAERINRD